MTSPDDFELVSDLIPPPPVIRERLARAYQQVGLLRRLLRISLRADEIARGHHAIFGPNPNPQPAEPGD